jgi:hypothetical protein
VLFTLLSDLTGSVVSLTGDRSAGYRGPSEVLAMSNARVGLFFSVAVALSGCSSAHQSVDVGTGIYDLTVSGESDACSPLRTTGAMGTVGVVAIDDVLNLSVPDVGAEASMLVSLSRGTGFHDERSESLPTCTDATLERSYTVVAGDAARFTVVYRETWRGLSSCGTAMRSVMPAAPTADCTADLVLDYQLATECLAPCEIQLTGSGATCSC